MSDQPIRVGLIGAGANTRLLHIPNFQAIDGVEVVAVCNRSMESGQRVADDFGIPRVVTDPDEIYGDETIDAICVGTWPYRHSEFTVRGLNAGKHVLCEARMSTGVAGARAMLIASQARPDLVAQLVPAPWDFRSWRTVRRLLDEGALGDLREVHVTRLAGGALNPSRPLHWREHSEYSGFNAMEFGIVAEIVQRWLGPTERVLADAATFTTTRRNEETGEDYTIEIPDSLGVFARLANGARATYLVSSVTDAPRVANGIAIHGTEATLHWWADGDRLELAPRGEEPRPLDPDPGTDGSWRVEADFIDSIREGAPVELTNFADGVQYMQVIEGTWRSWSEGRAVDIAEV